ncbi:phosphotransferase family protein [Streptomyces sp. CB01580]|uniref:phosphotransferase family protein n=1 Tax=Streptomyces sp. CB01580 TaxID=1703933 RepID=UPI00093E1390|nr:aminoglycoside phosphotransferase family protein [Streptomyces sp. CB01580]
MDGPAAGAGREGAAPSARRVLSEHGALLSRLLPDDEPAELAVRRGQFHDVVIGSDRVVCLPRTRAAAARLPEREAVLRVLAGLDLGFRTPEPLGRGEVHGGGAPGGGTPFLVLGRIPGEPLTDDALGDPRVVCAAAEQYAALLRGLARAGADETVRAAVPREPEGRWPRFAESVRAELFALMSDAGRLRAEGELAALDGLPRHGAAKALALVHGDLGAENVLWEWEGGLPRLAGVLDWDDIVIGDPAEDLAAIGASHDGELLGRVLALCGGPEFGCATRMATRIAAIRGTFALQQALCGMRDGDEGELADGLAGYR